MMTFKRLAMQARAAALLIAFIVSFAGETQAVSATNGEPTEEKYPSMLSSQDTDDDGLDDELEEILGTDPNNRYADKDEDGLYDFEEYLDLYGTPEDANDAPKYDYNDDSTYGNLLDIYHKFGLDSNKEGYLRDSVYRSIGGGFSNYLLWNVSFDSFRAGGSIKGDIRYINSILTDVSFSNYYAGGSDQGDVQYINSILTNVIFSGGRAGRSANGDVQYTNNILTNVTFSGTETSGSVNGDVQYTNNILTNVIFSGGRAGGSTNGDVRYINNILTNVIFSGSGAGRSTNGDARYFNNILTDVTFSSSDSGSREENELSFFSNTLINVTFSGSWVTTEGWWDGTVVIYDSNSFSNVLYVDLYRGSESEYGSIYYTNNIFDRVQFTELERWRGVML